MQRVYYSNRGFPLVYNGDPLSVPVLTVEAYQKWYTCYLVMPDGSVVSEDLFSAESTCNEEGITFWYDHVPNPRTMVLAANINKWRLDREAYEMVVGRYMIEICDKDPGNIWETLY